MEPIMGAKLLGLIIKNKIYHFVYSLTYHGQGFTFDTRNRILGTIWGFYSVRQKQFQETL